MHYKVSIIIPNRNGAELLQKNLPFVLDAAGGNEIIVVDDASTDASLDLLSKKFPSVKVIKKTHNDGFASSVNMGVREATGEIVVLLNTDVRPEKDFLAPLVKHFSDPSVFAVGCLEKSIEGGHTVLRGRGEAKWEKGFYIHWRGEVDKTTTAWVSGGSSAFRKSIWEKLGGMDTMYNPFYWEDIDFSYCAMKSGFTVLFEPKSVVVHEHETGAIKREYPILYVKIIAYRNQFLFVWKNLSDAEILLAHVIWTSIRLIQSMFRGDIAMLMGYVWAVLRVPRALASRVRVRRFWILKDLAVRLE